MIIIWFSNSFCILLVKKRGNSSFINDFHLNSSSTSMCAIGHEYLLELNNWSNELHTSSCFPFRRTNLLVFQWMKCVVNSRIESNGSTPRIVNFINLVGAGDVISTTVNAIEKPCIHVHLGRQNDWQNVCVFVLWIKPFNKYKSIGPIWMIWLHLINFYQFPVHNGVWLSLLFILRWAEMLVIMLYFRAACDILPCHAIQYPVKCEPN